MTSSPQPPSWALWFGTTFWLSVTIIMLLAKKQHPTDWWYAVNFYIDLCLAFIALVRLVRREFSDVFDGHSHDDDHTNFRDGSV